MAARAAWAALAAKADGTAPLVAKAPSAVLVVLEARLVLLLLRLLQIWPFWPWRVERQLMLPP